jgi:hypothetical protein
MSITKQWESLNNLLDDIYKSDKPPEGLPEDRISLVASSSLQARIKLIFKKDKHRQKDVLMRFFNGETLTKPPSDGLVGFQIRVFDGLYKLSKKPGYFKSRELFDEIGEGLYKQVSFSLSQILTVEDED